MRKFFALFLLYFLFLFPAYAAEDRFLNIQSVVSDSGITAWLVEDHTLPIISMNFAFKGSGSIQDTVEKQGTARILSNMLDEGAGNLTSQEFQKQLSNHSITLYFQTGRDSFGGEVKTLSRYKDVAFDLLTLSLNEPRFDAEPFQRMKEANIARIRSSMGEPDWISARLVNDLAYRGHPYALNSGGTINTIENLRLEDIKQFKQDYLSRDRLAIGVMGDITATELKDILDKVFKDLPTTGKPDTIKPTDLQNTNLTFLYNQDIPQTIIHYSLPALEQDDPDYYALKILNYILGGGGFGSRLMEEVREKRGLTYGIYSDIEHQEYSNILNISTSTKNESTEEVLKIIAEELEKLKTEKITVAELRDAQSYIIGSMPLSLTSTDKISSILLNMQLDKKPIDYLDHYAQSIRKVTPEDIQRVAQRLFTDPKPLIVLVGNNTPLEHYKKIESLPNVE